VTPAERVAAISAGVARKNARREAERTAYLKRAADLTLDDWAVLLGTLRRAQLSAYDPTLFAKIRRKLGDGEW
jgi:hypothetical protein